jgi:hypothetical protein
MKIGVGFSIRGGLVFMMKKLVADIIGLKLQQRGVKKQS